MTDDLSNYTAIKKEMFEFIEFGADIKYIKNEDEDRIAPGGYIISNYESNEHGRYFIVRNRTNIDTRFILYYSAIKKLYKKKTICDILIAKLYEK